MESPHQASMIFAYLRFMLLHTFGVGLLLKQVAGLDKSSTRLFLDSLRGIVIMLVHSNLFVGQ